MRARFLTTITAGLLALAGCGGDTKDETGSGGAGGSSGSGGASGGSGGASSDAGNVSCDNVTCGAGQFCCAPGCVPEGTPCSGFALHCDDASDCPGQLCCAQKPPSGAALESKCRPACDADGQMIVCRWSDPASCPPGMACQITAKLPPEFGYCA